LESLKGASFIFSGLAAALTAVGIGLAMIWAKASWGRYWAWDAKETGAFCILAWLIFSTAIHRWNWVSARAVLLLSIVGNTVVGLGWFGGLHNYGAKSSLMLAVVVASVFFFLVGLTPTGWLRSARN
jgi:ABC-type transport system involved in cytochrome c biogenesis permease subunit